VCEGSANDVAQVHEAYLEAEDCASVISYDNASKNGQRAPERITQQQKPKQQRQLCVRRMAHNLHTTAARGTGMARRLPIHCVRAKGKASDVGEPKAEQVARRRAHFAYLWIKEDNDA
jgi:hypothetical protein